MNSAYARWAARWRVPLGFLLVAAYLFFSRPTARLFLAGGIVALMGIAVRAYSAGYLIKNQVLATEGPYACTRNPLYFGSALLGTGFALAGGSWLLGVAWAIFFATIYWPVIRREEAFLSQEFGEAYAQYARRVPLFLPRWRGAGGAKGFDWGQYRKNREYEALLGYLAGMIFLALKMRFR